MQKISVDLWFDNNAQEAVEFYTSVFEDSKILNTTYYAKDMPGREGDVMYVEFLLNGQRFGAINGGPHFKFTPAVSIVVNCETQEEVDRYWNALSAVPEAEQCGWVQDKYGLSWQIVPNRLGELLTSDDKAAAERAMHAMLNMKKLDIAELEKAAAGV